jgi:hypothetical protein
VNYVTARDTLITHLHNNWSATYPAIPVYYENLAVDPDAAPSVFLTAELSFDDADQMSIELAPLTRVFGHLCLTVLSKEGQGTRVGLGYADFLINLFKFQNLSGVLVGTPTLGHKETRAGWHYQDVLIPFRFTS